MKPRYSLAVLLSFSLFACGGGSDGEGEAQDSTASALPDVLQKRAMKFDLSPYYVNATIYIPDTTGRRPKLLIEAEANDFGETTVRVNELYNIVIVELIDGDMNSKKTQIAEDLMYKNEIVEEGENYILYKSSIEGSHVEPVFHFYSIRDINGVKYEIHDYDEEGGYPESIARFMLESIKHMEVNNPA